VTKDLDMSFAVRPRAALLAVALSTALGTLAPTSALAAKPAAPAKVDIPYEQFTLPNGLRVIVHTPIARRRSSRSTSGTTWAARMSRPAAPVSRTCSNT
jgi:hypothetical protein